MRNNKTNNQAAIQKMQLKFFKNSRCLNGASFEDVEHIITKPIEGELKGVYGIKRVVSSSGISSSLINVEIKDNIDDE